MSAEVADTLAPDTIIAGHRLVGPLEQDRSTAAYRAVASDGAPVILRVLEPSGPAQVVRFEARGQALSELSHPAVAQTTGFGEAPEGLWLATAEIEGTTLRSLIDQGLGPMRAVRLLGEVADGIDAAHEAFVAHGDVRAENVIVQGRPVERAVLAGFPLDPSARGPAQDIAALAAMLRECLPREGENIGAHATAGALVAEAANRVLVADSHPEDTAPEAVATAPPKTRRTVGALTTAGALAAVAVAGVAGYAVSDRSEGDSPPAPRAADAGSLTVLVPPGWERARGARGLPELRDEVTLRRGSPSGAIDAGVAADRGAVLDPSSLVADIAGRAPAPRRVRLGALPALRFERAGEPSVIYVTSTSKGAPAVVCSGTGVAEPCARAAGGLALRGARPYDPAAGIAWKNRVAAEMRRLRARRARGLRALRAASTPAGQARAAARIGSVHAAAARRVRRLDAPPQAAGARRRVLGRLLAVDRAYRSLARAARADDRAAFGRDQRRIRRADRRLQVTLRSL